MPWKQTRKTVLAFHPVFEPWDCGRASACRPVGHPGHCQLVPPPFGKLPSGHKQELPAERGGRFRPGPLGSQHSTSPGPWIDASLRAVPELLLLRCGITRHTGKGPYPLRDKWGDSGALIGPSSLGAMATNRHSVLRLLPPPHIPALPPGRPHTPASGAANWHIPCSTFSATP